MALNSFGCTNEYAPGFARGYRETPAQQGPGIVKRVWDHLTQANITPEEVQSLPKKERDELLCQARVEVLKTK